MPIYRLAAITCCLLLLTSAHALPEQPSQPQFKSSELQVTVNRAKRTAAGQLATSLVFRNISRENVAVYGTGGAAIMTDTGETAESADVSGLPICTTSCQIPHAAIGVYVDPVIVEKDNAMMATFVFPGDAKSGSCSVDLTIRVYIARLGESHAAERQRPMASDVYRSTRTPNCQMLRCADPYSRPTDRRLRRCCHAFLFTRM